MREGFGGRWIGRRAGLANRVAFAFALISLVVALMVSGATYFGTSIYLMQQREEAVLSRALIDARVVDTALADGVKEGRALDRIVVTEDSQPLLQVGDVWYSSNVTVSPRELPKELLEKAGEEGGAWQRFNVSSGEVYVAVAVPVQGGMFVESFSFATLEQVLTILQWVLIAAAILAFLVGGGVGRAAGIRLLRPLGDIADGARRITAGDMRARVPVPEDPDLSAISTAFNEMADAVQGRLERERRFSANVSHELRSPLTGIVGTADLLERRIERLPDREANLIRALSSQVRRFSSTVLDLLEISRIGGDEFVQRETIDIGNLVDEQLATRGLDTSIRAGESCSMLLDPRRFERIVGNLIENAQRHGEGVTSIDLERTETGMRLIVDDSGPGVPEDLALQIFEPFARGDATSPDGAGLGLAIVREQVRLLGGSVQVSTSPNGGARFIVELPEGG